MPADQPLSSLEVASGSQTVPTFGSSTKEAPPEEYDFTIPILQRAAVHKPSRYILMFVLTSMYVQGNAMQYFVMLILQDGKHEAAWIWFTLISVLLPITVAVMLYERKVIAPQTVELLMDAADEGLAISVPMKTYSSTVPTSNSTSAPATARSDAGASVKEVKEDANPLKKHHFPQVDYLKVLANIFVVAHHGMACRQPPEDSSATGTQIYYSQKYVGAFHEPVTMPTMVICSGLVYTPVITNARARVILQLFACFYLFETISIFLTKYTVYREHEEEKDESACFCAMQSPLETWDEILNAYWRPYYHLWYIWCLPVWRLLSPYFMCFKMPILAAIFISAMCGFYKEELWSLSVQRPMGYFPYFIIGVMLKERYLSPLMKVLELRAFRIWGTCLLLLHFLTAWYSVEIDYCQTVPQMVYHYRAMMQTCVGDFSMEQYMDPNDNYWLLAIARAANFPISGVVFFALLSMVPTVDSPIRRAGERTLGPYILHRYLMILLRAYTPLMDDFSAWHMFWLYVCLYSFIFFLYLPGVHEFLRPVILPDLTRLGWFTNKKKGL